MHISDRDRLRADCVACIGLCCVGPGFAASADFAIDKPPGRPCPHLGGDDLCTIHDRLPARGFGGCVSFDCFGAGQRVVAGSLAGRHWRDGTRSGFAALEVVRALHEILWYLLDARSRPRAAPLGDDVDALAAAIDSALDSAVDRASDDLAALTEVDVAAWRRRSGELLGEVSDLVRAPAGPDLQRTDLSGRDLRGHDLAGAGMRGALLLGADLRGADLTRADLLGADLRGADVRGTDLASALFLTSPQLTSARGDATTAVPDWFAPPSTWTVA